MLQLLWYPSTCCVAGIHWKGTHAERSTGSGVCAFVTRNAVALHFWRMEPQRLGYSSSGAYDLGGGLLRQTAVCLKAVAFRVSVLTGCGRLRSGCPIARPERPGIAPGEVGVHLCVWVAPCLLSVLQQAGPQLPVCCLPSEEPPLRGNHSIEVCSILVCLVYKTLLCLRRRVLVAAATCCVRQAYVGLRIGAQAASIPALHAHLCRCCCPVMLHGLAVCSSMGL